MLRFGSANNFAGQIAERTLKAIVKDHTARIPRCPATFAEQCAVREYESNVIKYDMADLSNQLGVSVLNRTTSAAKSELQGKFTLTLSETNNRGICVSQDLVSWHDVEKDKMRCHVSDLFIFAIWKYSHVNGYTDKFKVTRYTTHKNAVNNTMDDTIKYYATEYTNGEKRYDYAMIIFAPDEVITATCPAKILGFVRYNITKGVPTPQFSGNEELSLDTNWDNDTVDNNVYMVVHTASNYVLLDQLQSDFITSFTLGNNTELLDSNAYAISATNFCLWESKCQPSMYE